jgi:8-oxo-dGTP diphosphatase
MRLVLVVACALVDADKRVLIAQRPEGGSMPDLWEFPGGKIEPGETPEQALVRELMEELGIAVDATVLMPLSFASHAYGNFHLLMPVFLCRKWNGVPQPHAHAALEWVRPAALKDYPMPAADLDLIAQLGDFL